MYSEDFQSNNSLIENSVLDTKYVDPDYLFEQGYNFLDKIISSNTLDFLHNFLTVFSIAFLAIIIYVTVRMFEIRAKEHAHMHHEVEEYRRKQALMQEKEKEVSKYKDPRWSMVLNYLFSSNPNDWKLAILESDNMLFDLLGQLGFQGVSLGDKLKDANGDSFKSIALAWEVHTVRNKIAHEGSEFNISLKEAKRVIAIYEAIFQDYGFI